MKLDSVIAEARKAFVAAVKKRNLDSDPLFRDSVAADWTGRGFKDQSIQREWQAYLKGWTDGRRQP